MRYILGFLMLLIRMCLEPKLLLNFPYAEAG